MVSALSLTLNMPNIGLIIYYLVCVILIPILLVNTGETNLLSLYLPLLLPIAVMLKKSGQPNFYQNLLIGEETNIVSLISSIFITILTVMGVFWYSLELSFKTNNVEDGIMIGVVMTIIILGSSFVLLPEGIRKFDKLIKDHTDFSRKYEWHRYVIGFVILLIIMGAEMSIYSLYDVKKNIRNEVKF
jgi:hypothetical protein